MSAVKEGDRIVSVVAEDQQSQNRFHINASVGHGLHHLLASLVADFCAPRPRCSLTLPVMVALALRLVLISSWDVKALAILTKAWLKVGLGLLSLGDCATQV